MFIFRRVSSVREKFMVIYDLWLEEKKFSYHLCFKLAFYIFHGK